MLHSNHNEALLNQELQLELNKARLVSTGSMQVVLCNWHAG